MCMQDIAISQRVTWRRAAQLPVISMGGVTVRPLAISPLRVAAFAGRTYPNTPADIVVNIDGVGTVALPLKNPTGTNLQYLDIGDYPGIFNSVVYAADVADDTVWYEAVIDADLSMAVQDLNKSISQKGG